MRKTKRRKEMKRENVFGPGKAECKGEKLRMRIRGYP
jgi:hypothetical protein